MAFTPSTRYCPVRHSPSFAIPNFPLSRAALKYIVVHMREQKNKEKDDIFSKERVTEQWVIFQEKRGGFAKICSISSDSTLFSGQIWGKVPQNPC